MKWVPLCRQRTLRHGMLARNLDVRISHLADNASAAKHTERGRYLCTRFSSPVNRPVGKRMMKTIKGATSISRMLRSALPFHSTCQFTCHAASHHLL